MYILNGFSGRNVFENFEQRRPGLKTGMDNARILLGDTPLVDDENSH